MKLQIDTNSKTIKIEGTVKIKDFIDQIQKFLPQEWQDYKLETNTTIYKWANPYIYRSDPYDYTWKYDGLRDCHTVTCKTDVPTTNTVHYTQDNIKQFMKDGVLNLTIN